MMSYIAFIAFANRHICLKIMKLRIQNELDLV